MSDLTLAELAQTIMRIPALIDEVKELVEGQKWLVTIKDIAAELGYTERYVREHHWTKPNFGRPDIDGARPRWLRPTWKAWRREIDRHKRDWEAASRREREEMMGIRKGAA